LNTNQDLGVKVATPIGNLVGQLFFGWLADAVGRKKMCKSGVDCALLFFLNLFYPVDGFELIIIIIGSFAQALSGSAPAVGIIGVLIVWRFIVRVIIFITVPSSPYLSSDGRRYWR